MDIEFYKGNDYRGSWNISTQSTQSTYYQVGTGNLMDYVWGAYDRIEVRFDAGNNVGSVLYIDDVAFGCSAPRNLYAQFLSSTTAALSWDVGGGEDQWEVLYGTSGAMNSFIISGSTDTVIGGLDDNNQYAFYVRAICAPGDTSSWSPVFELCKAYSIPLSQDFETTPAQGVPSCWYTYTAGWSFIEVYDCCEPYTGNNFLAMNLEGLTQSLMASPALDEPIDTLAMTLYAKNNQHSTAWLIAGVMTNPNNPATFDTIGMATLSSNYEQYSFFFDQYTGNGKHIAIMLSAPQGNNAYIYVDDLMIDYLPDCMPPTNFQTDYVDTDSVYLSWDDPGQVSWELIMGEYGFDKQYEGTHFPNLGHSFLGIGGLDAATTYEAYLRTLCASESSYWKKVMFTTGCVPFPIPFTEDFDSPMGGDMPNCWETLSGMGYSESFVTSWGGVNWSHALNMRIGSQWDTGYAITPQLADPLDSLMVSFSAYEHTFDHGSQQGNAILTLGLMSNPHDANSFTPVHSFTLSHDHQLYYYELGQVPAGNQRIAFRLTTQTHNYTEIFIDDVSIDHPATCFIPTNVYVDASSNSATVHWQPGATDTVWNLLYAYHWDDPFTYGTLITGITDTMYTIGGLQADHHYQVLLQADCGGGDLSAWTPAYHFYTPCPPISAPYQYGFDDIMPWDMPQCWNTHYIHSHWDAYLGNDDIDPRSPYNHLHLNNGTSPDPNAQLWISTPLLLDVNQKQVSFYAKSPQSGTPLEVGTLTDPYDYSTWISAATYTLTTSYQEYIVPLDFISGDVHVAFRHGMETEGNDRSIFIDDFAFDYIPACPRPQQLAAYSPDTSELFIQWAPGGSESTWEVQVYDTLAQSLAWSQTVHGDTFVTAGGLTAGTWYQVTVRADCGGGELSSWSDPLMVRTACPIMMAPFTEGFEGPEFPPMCWTHTPSPEGGFAHTSMAGAYGQSNASIAAPFYNIPQGNTFHLETPIFDASTLAHPFLYFDYAYAYVDINHYDNLEVYYSVDSGATYSLLHSFSGKDDLNTAGPDHGFFVPQPGDWNTMEVNLPPTANMIRFTAISNWGNNLFLDNISVDEAPACITPYGLQALATGTDTAQVTWNGNAPEYHIEYILPGQSFTGSPSITGISDTAYTISGLNHSTTYQYRVKAVCGPGTESNWSLTSSFTTLCQPFGPFSESFDYYPMGSMPNCWTAIVTNNPEAFVGIHDYLHYSWPHSLVLYNGHTPVSGAEVMAVTPELINIQQHQVRFQAIANEHVWLEVGTVQNPNDPNSFTLLRTLEVFQDHLEYYVSLDTVPAGHSYLAFRHPDPNVAAGQGLVISIDDFIYEPLESCPPPLPVMVNHLGTGEAMVQWEVHGGASQWELEWGEAYLHLGEGTRVLLNDNSYVIQGMTPGNYYRVNVRAVCGPATGDTSQWTISQEFQAQFGCTPNAVHGQPANHMDMLQFASEDINSTLFQNFHDIHQPFDGINLWAITTDYDGTSYPECYANPIDMEITFYNDNNGYVGSPVASFIIPAIPDSTGATIGMGHQIYEYHLQLPQIMNMSQGWFSVRSVNTPNCYTAFATTHWYKAQGICLRVSGAQQDTSYHSPLAFCFLDNSATLQYLAGPNGTLQGQLTQTVPGKGQTTPVYAVADPCYEFIQWDDNRTDNPRYDSLITIDKTIEAQFALRTIEHFDTAFICQGDTLFFGSQTLTTPGDYSEVFLSPQSCDSTVFLTLYTHPAYEFVENQATCQGTPYVWRGNSYDTAGTFYDSLFTVHGCDSVYVLHLQVNPVYEMVDNEATCQGTPFVWRGNSYTATGTYYDSLTTAAGCDSVYVLHLQVGPVHEFTFNEQTCQGTPFIWQGGSYDSSGTYYDSLTTVHGCDSVLILNLQVNPVYEFVENQATCQGAPYVWRGNSYNTAGTYYDSLFTVHGCDSVYVLNLQVNPVYEMVDNEATCQGTPFVWRGNSYTAAGTYYDSLVTAVGCDSVHVLHLQINPVHELTFNEQTCEGTPFIWQGSSYDSSGTYYDSLTSVHGCDSVLILNLQVNPVYEFVDNEATCQGTPYVWRGNSYDTAGTYYDSLFTVYGCDSVYVLNLHVNPVYDSLYQETICHKDVFIWRNNTYHLPGIYYDSLLSSAGCDSVFVLDLDVFYVDDSVSLDGITLTSHAVNATYQWVDCDDGYQPVSGADGSSFTPSQDGEYAVIVTQGACTDTSACISVIGTARYWQLEQYNIAVYPNPGNGLFYLELPREAMIRVHDVVGAPVFARHLTKGTHALHLEHLASGVYVLTAQWKDQKVNIKLIIQK